MNLTVFIQILAFLQRLAPLVPMLYDTMAALFPAGTPGAVKLAAFKAAVEKAVAEVEELKPFAALLEQAWPHLQSLVDRYHAQVANPQNPTAAAGG